MGPSFPFEASIGEVADLKVKMLFALIGLVALIGCSSNPMVGTWKMEIPESAKTMSGDATGEMVFKGDNSFTMTMKGTAMGQPQNMVVEGTYKLTDKTLALTATKTTLNDKEMPTSDNKAQEVTLSADMKSFTDSAMMGAKFVKQ